MAEANDMYGSIYQNLLDAGCDQQTADQCMGLVKENRFTDMMQVLARYRKIKLKNYNKIKENEKWKTRIPEHLRLTLRLR